MAVEVGLNFINAFDLKKSEVPCFISDKAIEGQITILDPENAGFELVKICLEGKIANTVSYAEWPSRQHQYKRKQQTLTRMSDVKKRSDFQEIVESGTTLRKCTFKFHVPPYLGRSLLGEDSEHLSDLPASLLSLESGSGGFISPNSSSGSSHVKYTVRVDVIREEHNVGTVTKSVNILPSIKPRPPMFMADFGNEYNTSCTKVMRGNARLSFAKVGDLTVKAGEPEPVIMRRPNDPITVTLPLKVMLQPLIQEAPATRRASRDQQQLQQQSELILGGKFHCKASLISSTYISVVERQGVPTRSDTEKSTTLARNNFTYSRSTTDITPSHHWAFDKQTGSLESRMTAVLPFNEFKHDETLLPTFDSSLISHRYRIALKMSLVGPSRMNFTLEVPVMLRYSSKSDKAPQLGPIGTETTIVSDIANPLASAESLARQFRALGVSEAMWGDHAPHVHNIDLDSCHPGELGIDAPPYVV